MRTSFGIFRTSASFKKRSCARSKTPQPRPPSSDLATYLYGPWWPRSKKGRSLRLSFRFISSTPPDNGCARTPCRLLSVLESAGSSPRTHLALWQLARTSRARTCKSVRSPSAAVECISAEVAAAAARPPTTAAARALAAPSAGASAAQGRPVVRPAAVGA